MRETARQVGSNASTVCRWAREFKWDERLAEYGEAIQKRKEAGCIIRSDDPSVQKMQHLVEQVEALIDSAFLPDIVGKPKARLRITTADELVRLVAEYRKILESFYRFMQERKPELTGKQKAANIGQLNMVIGDMSQEERIQMMEALRDGNVKGGNSRTARAIPSADRADVSERGDAD